MDTLFADLPEDLSALTEDELAQFISETQEKADAIAADPASFLVEDRDFATLKAEMQAAVERIAAAKAELRERLANGEKPGDSKDDKENDDDEDDASAQADELAALAAQAHEEFDDDEEPAVEEPEAAAAVEEEPKAAEPVIAASASKTIAVRRPLPRPARSRKSEPPVEETRVALTAAAEGLGFHLGQSLPDEESMAGMMIKRRNQFGDVPEGTHGDRIPIARADWSDLYPDDRKLVNDPIVDTDKVNQQIDDRDILRNFELRRKNAEPVDALTASGGLCAPVTPYYQLMMLAGTQRPVRAALPSFNADRGGIRYARPASLSAISTAVGIKTAVQDANGGSDAVKTCQVVDCPPFTETDVAIVYHCLQFGNLGARTFPERVTQWNSLVLAAHARAGETLLLDGISAASTQVTAGALGLGASATLPSQILTAAAAMRSRNRMDPNTVLRVMLPGWVLDLLVSDMYRTQFERFDLSQQDFVRILRDANVEPTFYVDGPTGGAQVFGTQGAGSLLTFPTTIKWYIFPEGSFLYVDGGVLELGLVRDSVLNRTNDFQIFGESFENVAFIGIESLAVTSTTCDSGTVTLPKAVNCPITY